MLRPCSGSHKRYGDLSRIDQRFRGFRVADDSGVDGDKPVCRYLSRNSLQELGRLRGLEVTANATFQAVLRKQNGPDASQDGYL